MVVIILILLCTFFMCSLLKKSFGKSLPITLMFIPTTLYLSQFIFKTFAVGMWINVLASFLGLGTLLYKMFKKDTTYLKNIFSKGFFAFLLVFVLLFITDYQQQFSAWDELAHWGVMVKEMLRLDNFYAVKEALMVWHKDYPPFMSLFEYFWCKILGYSEQNMYLSLHVYMFGLVVPYFVDKLKKKSTLFIFPFLYLVLILMMQ